MSTLSTERGQAMAEHGLIFCAIIIVSLAVLWLAGGGIAEVYTDIVESLPWAAIEATETAAETAGACVDRGQVEHRRSGHHCSHSEDCDRLSRSWYENLNSGSYTSDGTVQVLIVKAGRSFHILTPGSPSDGCISAVFNGNTVSWQKADIEDETCRNVRHAQIWTKPL